MPHRLAGPALLALCLVATPAAAESPYGLFKDGRKVLDISDFATTRDAARTLEQALPTFTRGLELYRDVLGRDHVPSGEATRYGALAVAARDLVATLERPGSLSEPGAADRVARLAELAAPVREANDAYLNRLAAIGRNIADAGFPTEKQARHAALVRAHGEAAASLIDRLDSLSRAHATGSPVAAPIARLADWFAENPLEPERAETSDVPRGPTLMEIVPAPVVPLDPNRRVTSAYPIAPGTERGTPSDLDETIDVQFTPDIDALAASLGSSPARMYEYVRNNVEFEAYLGSRKGAQQTLDHGRGNDVDIASLLIALYRTSGIPARYAEGRVRVPIDRYTNWLGVDDKTQAGSLLATAGLQATLEIFGSDTVSVSLQRVWVEAYVPFDNYRGAPSDTAGARWIPLDPAFKQYDVTPGINFAAEQGVDGDTFVDDYISTFRVEPPIEKLEADLLAALPGAHPGLGIDDIVDRRSVRAEEDGILPGTLPYELVTKDGVFSEVVTDDRYHVRFHLHDGGGMDLDYTTSTPELAGKQVTISYIGATTADQDVIDAAGSFFNIATPYLVDVVPQLKIDGCVVATASGFVTMGYSHGSDMHFTPPVGASNQVPAVFNTIAAGNSQGIGIDTQDALPALFDVPSTTCDEDYLTQELHQTALTYLNNVDRAEDRLAELLHVVHINDVSEAIVESSVRILFSSGLPITFDWTGMIVDADRKIVGSFAVDGQATPYDFLRIGGADGSVQENRVFETRYDEEAISAIKILGLAADSLITICDITTSIGVDCPDIDQSASVIAAINAALGIGHRVIIPERDFTYYNWSGTGYIDLDPTSGAAGYIIAGGQSGGATVQDWSAELAGMLASGTICIEPSGTITVAPAADVGDDKYCRDNDANWEFTVPTIQGWGVDEDDNCKATNTLTNETFTVTNYTIKELADSDTFGPGTYTFRIGSPIDPYGCGCTIIEKEVTIYAAVVKTLNPSGEFELGSDLAIDYEVVPSDFSFDSAKLQVKNANDDLVYEMTGLDGSGGAHSTMWEKGKWNQGSTPYPYANPKNGEYEIIVVGTVGGMDCESEPETVETKLVLEADITDPEPGAMIDRAGLEDMIDALKIVLSLGGSETIFQGTSQITETPTDDYETKIKVEDPGLNSLDDGDYEVIFRDLRDELGNFGDEDPGTAGIQEIKFDLRLK